MSSRNCAVCGRSLKTGRKYCYEHRGYREEHIYKGSVERVKPPIVVIVIISFLLIFFVNLYIGLGVLFVSILILIILARKGKI